MLVMSALALAQPSGSSADRAPAALEAPLDTVLKSCLLPTPAGYVASPQVHQRQMLPFELSAEQRARLLFPYAPELAGRSMGWTRSDREYTAAIPLEAREIPRDLSALPVLRFNNLEIHGERDLRWRAHGEYDQWFLHDVTRKLDALMTIHRETRRVYFFEYHWQGPRPRYDQSTESCYSCHVSGPRLVRTYDLPKVDLARLAEFNRKLLSYGAADFGDSLDPARLGPPLSDARCTPCHDGRTRGKLYAQHSATIAYYLDTLRLMPPAAPLSAPEARRLLGALQQHAQRPAF